MGKYGQYSRGRELKPRRWAIHPVWRGIGCLMMILVPILAYAGAVEFLNFNQKNPILPLTADMYQPLGVQYIRLEDVDMSIPVNLGSLTTCVLAFTVVFMVLGYALYSLIYAIFYKSMAPPRYGPLDSPPVGKYRPPTGRVRR